MIKNQKNYNKINKIIKTITTLNIKKMSCLSMFQYSTFTICQILQEKINNLRTIIYYNT